jgi:dipeptidyl aminopeptidase/acylaminoacyl peptidase
MRGYFANILGYAAGMALSACTFSVTPRTPSVAAVTPDSQAETQSAARTALPTAESISPTPAFTSIALDPAAEPKGSIVFEKGIYGDKGFYLVEPDSSGPGVLTPLSVGGYDPSWSPDGQWIVFATSSTGSANLAGNMYILNAAKALSGVIEPVLQVEGGRKPDWQPAA